MGQPRDEPSFLSRALDRQQGDKRLEPVRPPETPEQRASREAAERAEAARRAAEQEAREEAERAEREARELVRQAAAEEAAAQARDQRIRDVALITEAMKKSGLIWVRTPTAPRGQAVWHAWADDRAYLLTGADEQPDPGLESEDSASIVVRSKDNLNRLVQFTADVTRLRPGDDDWQPATAELAKARLNLHHSEAAPDRWANDTRYVLYRLTPTAGLSEQPGAYDDSSGRAAPVPTTATTVTTRPWVLHKRGGSGSRLS